MSVDPVVPRGEPLRRALAWIAEQGRCDAAVVEAAALRFDLAPRDEEFLLRQLVHHNGVGSPERDA